MGQPPNILSPLLLRRLIPVRSVSRKAIRQPTQGLARLRKTTRGPRKNSSASLPCKPCFSDCVLASFASFAVEDFNSLFVFLVIFAVKSFLCQSSPEPAALTSTLRTLDFQ